MVPSLRVGDFLRRSDDWIETRPDERYKQITARLWGNGLTLRGEALGSEIAASRQIRARAGQFLLSRIDARHGAYGIVPEELDGALVSNDFPCFDIDAETVLPGYFLWYSRTEAFIDLCRRSSEGSTNRVRLKEAAFLDMQIEVPPLAEQHRIVARLDRVAGLVEGVKSRRAQTDADATQLLERLHFDLASNGPRRFGEFVSLWEDRAEITPDQSYPQIGIRGFAGGLFFKEATAGSDTSYKSFNRLHPDMLIVSQPKGWEGAIAVAEDEHAGWFVSPEYRTFVCREDSLLPAYLRQLVGTNWFQSELAKLTRGQGARRERLRPDMLLDMPIRMPPLAAQRKALAIHEKIQRLRAHTAPFTRDADTLIPALLHEVFNGKAVAA